MQATIRVPALTCLLLGLAALGCADPSGDRAPDQAARATAASSALAGSAPIVMISIDTLRSDRLPAYGYAGVETPAIDRLRRDGVMFARAYSPIPLTTPAHVSLMTGLWPPSHGVRDNAGYHIRADGPPVLAARLAAHGYRTGGAVASYTMRRATGLGIGFEHYDDRIEAGERQTIGQSQRSGDEALDALLPWLREVAAANGGSDPFFAFLHLYEPHSPYTPPPPFDRFADPYDGEIAVADAVVGRLLDELDRLGAYDRSIIVVLSDHGEGLDDHGEPEHGILLYREALQIPLIVKLPASELNGTTVDRPVGLVDVMPTLLEVVGAPAVADIDGRSLWPLLTAEPATDSDDRSLYGESYHGQLRYGWAGLTSVIAGRWHLIDGPDPELYDLVADPAERTNRLRDERRVYARLKAVLADLAVEPRPPGAIDEETRRNLESLGYLGGTRSRDGPLPDPKSQLSTLEPLRQGVDALAAGDQESAIVLLRQALEANDRFEAAWSYLGLAYEESDQPEQALDAYRRAFELTPGAPELVDALVRMTLRLGKLADASAFLDLALEQHPTDLDMHLLAARTLLMQRRFDEAAVLAEATLALDPDHPDARYQMGAAAMGLGDLEAAQRHLLSAIEAAGGAHPPALQDLAVLFLSQGRRSEARRLLERLLEIQPENRPAADLLARIGSG